MQLDLTSLLVVSQIISVACGVMFALDSAHGRAPFAPWFAAAFLSSPVASILYLLPNLGDGWLWAYPIGNAIATLTVSLTWVGARSVNGRTLPHLVALTVPACIAGMVLILEPLDGPWTGSLPFFLSFGAFSALSAAEFWHGGVEEPRLRHSTVLAIICGVNACWFFTRALGLLTLGSTDPVFLMALGTESTTILLLVMIVGASLSLIAIGRERALNLAQTLATQDALTGLLNRGAFVRQAEALSRAAGKRQTSYALLLFDLDHFKAINDTHGHLIGDEVLVAFASAARARVTERGFAVPFRWRRIRSSASRHYRRGGFHYSRAYRARFCRKQGRCPLARAPYDEHRDRRLSGSQRSPVRAVGASGSGTLPSEEGGSQQNRRLFENLDNKRR